ncbi:MAG TPA: beta-N-acetylhexosaminidase [Tepidisphaeraceae bacterium]|nr:beta-N-acetylhexosaminidase [Tepidisphaeraceae bacterium]
MTNRAIRWTAAVAMLFVTSAATAIRAFAQTDISVIPMPVSVTKADGAFVLTSDTRIVVSDETLALGHDLADMLRPATGLDLSVSSEDAPRNVIRLSLDLTRTELGDEGYRLSATPDSVTITAPHTAGIFYGLQTLRQLLPPDIFSASKVSNVEWSVPSVQIEDYPRLRWRGMMLDCSRHFMPKEFVERFIDLLAMHKMNSFHWHLTDDQGWRIEIKKYPRLTSVGGWRKETLVGHEGSQPVVYDGIPYGGFYTQEDIRQIVAYAADRFVNVVPEIEMPGHSAAAIAAYPDLGCTSSPVEVWTTWGVNPNILNPSEHTIQFYQDVLDEVLDLFPSKFIHLGGDEVPLEQWDNNPEIQKRVQSLGLQNSAQLQRYMLRRMEEFLRSKGRRLVGWDEILDSDLPKDAVVMSWRGIEQGVAAAEQGHDVVMAPLQNTYFDHYQSKDTDHEPLAIGGFLPLSDVYAFDPVPANLSAADAAHLLGSQGQIWTEYIPTPQRVEYMAYPRACALAEVFWSPTQSKDYSQFKARLAVHLQRLREMNVNYRPIGEGE